MANYWNVYGEVIDRAFSFSYPLLDGAFYLGVVRSYMSSIKFFIKSFLKKTLSDYAQNGNTKAILRDFYKAYKVQILIDHLAKLHEKTLKKPDYYFSGYRMFLRLSFFRHLVLFCTKIFILANQSFSQKDLKIDGHIAFFQLWKRIYKNWLNIYYQKKTAERKVPRVELNLFRAMGVLRNAITTRNSSL